MRFSHRSVDASAGHHFSIANFLARESIENTRQYEHLVVARGRNGLQSCGVDIGVKCCEACCHRFGNTHRELGGRLLKCLHSSIIAGEVSTEVRFHLNGIKILNERLFAVQSVFFFGYQIQGSIRTEYIDVIDVEDPLGHLKQGMSGQFVVRLAH